MISQAEFDYVSHRQREPDAVQHDAAAAWTPPPGALQFPAVRNAAELTAGQRFYYLLHADQFPESATIAWDTALSTLSGIGSSTVPDRNLVASALRALQHGPTANANDLHALTAWVEQRCAPPVLSDNFNAAAALAVWLPSMQVDRCWLQNVTAAAIAHTPLSACLFRLYRRGAELRADSRLLARCLAASRTQYADVRRPHLLFDRTSQFDEALALPTFQLALGLFPRHFMPALVGYTLAHAIAFVSLAPGLRALTPAEYSRDFSFYHAADLADARLAIVLASGSTSNETDALFDRMADGFVAGVRLIKRLARAGIAAGRSSVGSAHAAMRALLVAKRAFASGHHHGRQLHDRALEDWFSASAFDPDALLDALAHSEWIDRAQPLCSRFLTELLAFGGPMYKVFSEPELETVRSWLLSLPAAEARGGEYATQSAHRPAIAEGPSYTVAQPNTGGGRSRHDGLKRGTRHTYRVWFHRLINADHYPADVAAARSVIAAWLTSPMQGAERFWHSEGKRFGRYSPAGFRARIDAIYTEAVSNYQRTKPILDRAEYVWLLTQLAPLFLVDGCWLQQAHRLLIANADVAEGLEDIFADEIGAGETLENHSNVYRRLLMQEGIALPPVTSTAFSESRKFSGGIFALPVLLLGISHHAKFYLPELLGLNLAIELSGLGRFYKKLIDDLRHWSIDPTIFSLHLAIDNYGSGHAAIARRLVETYLDKILSMHGEPAMQAHWRRVWNGYRALEKLTYRSCFGLLPAFILRFGRKRLLDIPRRWFHFGFS